MIENHRLIYNTCEKIYNDINILSDNEFIKNSHIKQIYNLYILYLQCDEDDISITKFKNSVRNIVKNMIKSYEGECLCYKIVNNNY